MSVVIVGGNERMVSIKGFVKNLGIKQRSLLK